MSPRTLKKLGNSIFELGWQQLLNEPRSGIALTLVDVAGAKNPGCKDPTSHPPKCRVATAGCPLG